MTTKDTGGATDHGPEILAAVEAVEEGRVLPRLPEGWEYLEVHRFWTGKWRAEIKYENIGTTDRKSARGPAPAAAAQAAIEKIRIPDIAKGACACLGPQNGQTLCPCALKQAAIDKISATDKALWTAKADLKPHHGIYELTAQKYQVKIETKES